MDADGAGSKTGRPDVSVCDPLGSLPRRMRGGRATKVELARRPEWETAAFAWRRVVSHPNAVVSSRSKALRHENARTAAGTVRLPSVARSRKAKDRPSARAAAGRRARWIAKDRAATDAWRRIALGSVRHPVIPGPAAEQLACKSRGAATRRRPPTDRSDTAGVISRTGALGVQYEGEGFPAQSYRQCVFRPGKCGGRVE